MNSFLTFLPRRTFLLAMLALPLGVRAGNDSPGAVYTLTNEADANRVIMARCETEEALKAGLAGGIRLFQGWHIDNMIRASREVVN